MPRQPPTGFAIVAGFARNMTLPNRRDRGRTSHNDYESSGK